MILARPGPFVDARGSRPLDLRMYVSGHLYMSGTMSLARFFAC